VNSPPVKCPSVNSLPRNRGPTKTGISYCNMPKNQSGCTAAKKNLLSNNDKYTRLISERKLTFTFTICCRPSVRLSVVCQSVTFVHPTQPVENFGNFSSPFSTLAINGHPLEILRRSFQGNPSVGNLNVRRVQV